MLEVTDSSLFKTNKNTTQNKFRYSLKIQVRQPVNAVDLRGVMQRDLKNYFGYDVLVEDRVMPCWKIIVLDSVKVKSNLMTASLGKKFKEVAHFKPFIFTNAVMRDITVVLGTNYGYGTYDYQKMPLDQQAPFIDETKIQGEIDFRFDRNWTFEECKIYFNDIELDIVKGQQMMKVVVIRDPK